MKICYATKRLKKELNQVLKQQKLSSTKQKLNQNALYNKCIITTDKISTTIGQDR